MRLLWLPDHLREWGLEPIEVDGWRDRGYGDFDTFRPVGVVDHHTAGATSGWAPSLGVVIRGRSDVPGPLSQLFTPRNPQGKHHVHVVAAGRANHAGAGGWASLSGNSKVVGHERENVGTAAEPWQPWQTEDAVLVAACVLDGLRRYERVDAQPGHYCEHKEWAPTRKSDAHTISGAAMRAAITARLTQGDDDMFTDADRKLLTDTRAEVGNLQDVSSRFVQVILQQIKDAVDSPDVAGGTGQISAADIDAIADEIFAREAKAAAAAVTK